MHTTSSQAKITTLTGASRETSSAEVLGGLVLAPAEVRAIDPRSTIQQISNKYKKSPPVKSGITYHYP